MIDATARISTMSIDPSLSSIETLPRPTAFKPRTCLSAKALMWRIETGVVRSLTWLEDGTVITLGIWKAGDIVGQALSQIEPHQIECLSQVEATPLFLEPDQLDAGLLLRHLRLQEELTVIRGYRRADDMLLKLLNWLAHRFGHSAKTGSVIDLRLTHQDLAEILGTTRVTITRILGQFEEQGVIERTSVRRIVLRETEIWHYQI